MKTYSSYGMKLLTNGTINCTVCHLASENIMISAKDLVSQSLKIEADDASIGPSLSI